MPDQAAVSPSTCSLHRTSEDRTASINYAIPCISSASELLQETAPAPPQVYSALSVRLRAMSAFESTTPDPIVMRRDIIDYSQGTDGLAHGLTCGRLGTEDTSSLSPPSSCPGLQE